VRVVRRDFIIIDKDGTVYVYHDNMHREDRDGKRLIEQLRKLGLKFRIETLYCA